MVTRGNGLKIIQICIYFTENVYSVVSNRRGRRNKRGGWQISAKIINREGAINGEVGKNLQS